MSQAPEEQPQLPKAYEPQAVEERLYRRWKEAGHFTPDLAAARRWVAQGRRPFVVIMPPPNVTGELHLGHAQRNTFEDILVRWHRMRGEPTLWLPGADHAAIAVHVVIERALAQEGLTRQQLGREEFLRRTWEFINTYRPIIRKQIERLGASCDWTRDTFTLDPGPARAVRAAFVNLYKKGLIYRGERIMNWSPKLQTGLSDLEVEYKEVDGHLWHVRYPIQGEPGRSITIATTRPETILADTGVAVHPKDDRYRDLVGKRALVPLMDRPVPIITDEAIDPAFGTGALKVTPAHDPTDFEIGQRHGLPFINIMNLDGTLNANAGPYAGLDRFQARRRVIADLKAQGLLEQEVPYRHSVGHTERTGEPVEPLISKQWWLRIKPLAEPAADAVRDGRIRIVPERFTKVYLNWMDNIRDWCLSRQLWWGHRIPIWYCDACAHSFSAVEDPSACERCASANIRQDPDVLDTWFSSGLWTHSTLGWPDDTEELRLFHPTAVMETAYDILFFWIARMVMMTLENTGQVPFETVFLGGLVRDERGDKMSKTKGNVLNPLELLDRYGTDALRYAVTIGITPGNDASVGPQKLEAGRNFANKLWNSARLVISSLPAPAAGPEPHAAHPEPTVYPEQGRREGRAAVTLDGAALELEDRWVLSRLARAVQDVDRNLREYQLGEALRACYEFIWHEYCDWYLELAKLRLRAPSTTPSPLKGEGRGEGEGHAPGEPPFFAHPEPVEPSASASAALATMVHVLQTSLRLLHPFMPFVTEELWQRLWQRLGVQAPQDLIVAPYPDPGKANRWLDEAAEGKMEPVLELVRMVRNGRAELRLEPGLPVEVRVVGRSKEITQTIVDYEPQIEALARCKLSIAATVGQSPVPGSDEPGWSAVGVHSTVKLQEVLPDVGKQRMKLDKEIAAANAHAERLQNKLADAAFTSKAPAAIVGRERQALAEAQDRLARLQEQRQRLG